MVVLHVTGQSRAGIKCVVRGKSVELKCGYFGAVQKCVVMYKVWGAG